MAKENDAIEEVVVQERRLSDKNPSGSGRGGNPFSGDAKAITQVLQGIAKGMFSPEGVANTISVGGYGIGKALKAKADAGDFSTNRGPTEYQSEMEERRNPGGPRLGPGSLLDPKAMGGMMYNKGSLVGNQSLLDKNDDGDITGEDFKMLRTQKVLGGLLNITRAGSKAVAKSLLSDATKEVKKISKQLPSVQEQKKLQRQYENPEDRFGDIDVEVESEIDQIRISNNRDIETLENFFSNETELAKRISELKKTIYKKIKDKDVADQVYRDKLAALQNSIFDNKSFKSLEREQENLIKKLPSEEQFGLSGFANLAGPNSVSEAEFIKRKANKLDPFNKGGRVEYQEGSLMMPPEMASDMPVDTYPNIPPEEMAEAEASQLPDAEMEDKYMDFVLDQSLDDDEQSYLMNALETDPKLSQIFDKVITTASEFTGAGEVEGPGTGVSDSIPARLSDGEFVFTKKATDQMGADNLQMMMDDAERAFDGGMMRSPKQEGGMMYKQKDEDPLAYEKIAQDEIKKNMLRANRAPSLLGGN